MAQSEPAPINPDVDLHVPAQRRELQAHSWPVLAVIAVGGVIGAESRYGLQHAFPQRPDAFGWTTFWINVSGCLLIGVLMVLVNEVWTTRRLLRPFLGVGVLGGFTTFSAYAVDIQQAVLHGSPRTALLYLAGTLVGALLAVWAGSTATTWMVRRRRAPAPDHGEPAVLATDARGRAR